MFFDLIHEYAWYIDFDTKWVILKTTLYVILYFDITLRAVRSHAGYVFSEYVCILLPVFYALCQTTDGN